ncbi:hypothetical protein GGQ64_005276 [Rhizobium azooxidifex]|uniref:Lipoprotein n=1 Tax=Mycoplana azooxidifex TaxID=1636188 RepID=A0A7W6GNI8_9HYPH|nr:hypothetical protein [Mycoplana azooxidifex]MBB3980029.1 hypothetical protein [Mycoplana azooxidifex]
MYRTHILTLMLSFGILAGCAPSEKEYEAIVTTLQGSAKARQFAISECVKGFSTSQRRAAAIIIDSTEKNAARVACTRAVEAMRSGRLTYADAVDMKKGKFTPKLVKIVQGR